jgi:putative tryptophan/tyrosine transport system substrate-binding protein
MASAAARLLRTYAIQVETLRRLRAIDFSNRNVTELALKHGLPAASVPRAFAEIGGLMSYGASGPDTFRRGASFVIKILQGVKPSDMPVEQPTKFELVVNLKTAKALGLSIAESFLLRADQVIE